MTSTLTLTLTADDGATETLTVPYPVIASGLPKVSTFSDTFPSGDSNWQCGGSTGYSATFANGLTLSLPASSGYTYAITGAFYDWTNSPCYINITSYGTQSATNSFRFGCQDVTGTNQVGFFVANSVVYFYQKVAGTQTILGNMALNTTSMAWLRLREASGTTYFDTAPDGSTWTSQFSVADPITMTSLQVYLSTDNGGAAYSVTVADLNAVVSPSPDVIGTQTLSYFTDLFAAFLPDFQQPVTGAADFTEITTPYGPGFQSVATDADIAPWSLSAGPPYMKTVSTEGTPRTMGATDAWTAYFYLPSQSICTTWNGGVLWEMGHQTTTSGHNLSIDNTGRGLDPTVPCFRIRRATGPNSAYDDHYTTAILWDHWYKMHFEVGWSLTSGHILVALDDYVWLDMSGIVTYISSEVTPYGPGFGWYGDSGNGLTNTVQFGGINCVTTAGS